MGEMRNAYRIWVGKPEGTWKFGRPELVWEENLWQSLKKKSSRYGLDWSGSGQGLVVGYFEYGYKPPSLKKSGHFLISCVTFTFSRKTLFHGTSWLVTASSNLLEFILHLAFYMKRNVLGNGSVSVTCSVWKWKAYSESSVRNSLSRSLHTAH